MTMLDTQNEAHIGLSGLNVGLGNTAIELATKRERIRAAMRKIAAQFPDYPEAKLMLGIVNQAANDLLDKTHKDEAKRYLMNAVHAETCGVDPAWIRETFEKMECF